MIVTPAVVFALAALIVASVGIALTAHLVASVSRLSDRLYHVESRLTELENVADVLVDSRLRETKPHHGIEATVPHQAPSNGRRVA